MAILFEPLLCEREFGSHLFSVDALRAWLELTGRHLRSTPAIEGYEFVQVERLLCAIEAFAAPDLTEEQACDVVANTPELRDHPAAEAAPRWLLGAYSARQWRKVFAQAIADGELEQLAYPSLLKVAAARESGSVPADGPTEPAGPEPVPAVLAQMQRAPRVHTSSGDESWREHAQTMAREIITRQAERDLYPPQKDIADEIAARFRKRVPQVLGTDGKPLAGATIKRHALKGISSAKRKVQSTTLKRGK